MQQLPPQFRSLFAELERQALDSIVAQEPHDLGGRLILARRKARHYWYLDVPDEKGGKKRIYIGPADNPDIENRVAEWKIHKAANHERRKIVSVLIREAYLPRPDRTAGRIIASLTADGVVSPGMILLGPIVYEAYFGMLGVRLPGLARRSTGAQVSTPQTISFAVREGLDPDVLDVLRRVDPTFRKQVAPAGSRMAGRFVCKQGHTVEFPIAGRDFGYYGGRLAHIPPPSQAAREPPRLLDFLVRQSVRVVLLYGAGLVVLVPTPERYAVHLLLMSGRNMNSDDNLVRASSVMTALIMRDRTDELARVFMEASGSGALWKGWILESLGQLDVDSRNQFKVALADGIRRLGRDPAGYGI